MLTLYIEAQTHEELTRQAIASLGIKVVEPLAAPAEPKAAAPAPAAVTEAPASVATPAPVAAASLPSPAPRKKREPKPTAAPAVPPVASPAAAPDVGQTSAAPPSTAATPAAAASSTTDWLAPPVPAAAAPAFPTVDEVRYVLGEVNGKFGMTVATQMLKDGGFERVSTIPEDKRAAFIATCKAKVATAA